MVYPFSLVKLCDLFLLASKFEGFPNVLIESLVCGVPVVASNCKGGIREIINPDNGLIADYDSFESMALKITEALEIKWDNNLISNRAKVKYSSKVISEIYFNALTKFDDH